MKNLLFFGLLLLPLGRATAQCAPDKLPPVLAPKSNVQVALGGPKCLATVKPTDLLQSVADNCTPTSKVQLRLRRAGMGSGFPSFAQGTSLTLSTTDLVQPPVVELWARDTAGNTAFIYTSLTLTNPAGCSFQLLPDTIDAMTENGDGLEDVQWLLEGVLPPPPGSFIPSGDRLYLTPDLFSGSYADNVYTVRPSKDDNPLNGVTTFDLVLMLKHLFNAEVFTSPYKYLAADTDRNGEVTTHDLSELRKLILGVYSDLPENTSWRFVPADYTPAAANPLKGNVPESVTFDRYRTMPLPDFIPIKVGDVSGNALTNSLTGAEDRAPVALCIRDTRTEAGATLSIPVFLRAPHEINGMQMAWSFDPTALDFTGISAGALPDFTLEHYFQPEPGRITVSWTTPNLKPFSAEEPLFYLQFKARRPALLSSILAFDARKLRPELYGAESRTDNLRLEFLPLPPPEQIRIGAPTPNPSAGDLTILVELAKAGAITVEILDLDGRLVYSNNEPYAAGAHRLAVPAEVFGNRSGVFLYRVQAGAEQAQGRVVVLH